MNIIELMHAATEGGSSVDFPAEQVAFTKRLLTLLRAEIIAELTAGVEMPEPDIFDTRTGLPIGHSRTQLRETVAAAVAKKDVLIEALNTQAHELTGQGVKLCNQIDELKTERDTLYDLALLDDEPVTETAIQRWQGDHDVVMSQGAYKALVKLVVVKS